MIKGDATAAAMLVAVVLVVLRNWYGAVRLAEDFCVVDALGIALQDYTQSSQ